MDPNKNMECWQATLRWSPRDMAGARGAWLSLLIVAMWMLSGLCLDACRNRALRAH